MTLTSAVANGGRIRLQPQLGWEINEPDELARVVRKLEEIHESSGIDVSFADLVVLGGGVAVEKAAKDAGFNITVPFAPGCGDATQEATDVESFAHLEPHSDGFRNYLGKGSARPAEFQLVDRANLLHLPPEDTVSSVDCGCWVRPTAACRWACSPTIPKR